MRTQTKETQDNLTPMLSLKILVEGNRRFTKNIKAQRNLQGQVVETSTGQYPFAVILSCIDSRVPVELIFDQGIGDVFSVRVAGNIINEDILGSMEFACKIAGSKIVVVLGHTNCGAVYSACENLELGNITTLLSKIQPAVKSIRENEKEMTDIQIEKVTELNVKFSIDRIKNESSILSEMEENGEIEIVGATYDVATGEVKFI